MAKKALRHDAPSPEDIQTAKRIKRLAWWLDECITLPGNIKIGLDGLLGLVPVIGDILGALLSSYVVYQAKRFGVPFSTLIKMIANVTLELVVGFVPVFGDLFDFYFKANQRNVKLLKDYEAFLIESQRLEEEKAGVQDTGAIRLVIVFVLFIPLIFLFMFLLSQWF